MPTHGLVLTLSGNLSRHKKHDKFQVVQIKIVECPQGFSIVGPLDILFDTKWPSIDLDPDFVEANILIKVSTRLGHNCDSKVSTGKLEIYICTTNDRHPTIQKAHNDHFAERNFSQLLSSVTSDDEF